MKENLKRPKSGGECPHCGYNPLYEDGGTIICVGCDARFDATGKAEDWQEPEEA